MLDIDCFQSSSIYTALLLEPKLEPGLHASIPCSKAGSLNSNQCFLHESVGCGVKCGVQPWQGDVKWGLGPELGGQ